MKFQIDITQTASAVEVVCSGLLTEEADFSGAKEKITQAIAGMAKGQIGFDLSKITRTNSVGIREWLLFLEQLPTSVPLVYHQISPLMVEQINMIPNALGQGKVTIESFQAPYHCASCGGSAVQVLKPVDVVRVNGKLQPPVAKCPKCGKPMELDWLEEEYFRFLKK